MLENNDKNSRVRILNNQVEPLLLVQAWCFLKCLNWNRETLTSLYNLSNIWSKENTLLTRLPSHNATSCCSIVLIWVYHLSCCFSTLLDETLEYLSSPSIWSSFVLLLTHSLIDTQKGIQQHSHCQLSTMHSCFCISESFFYFNIVLIPLTSVKEPKQPLSPYYRIRSQQIYKRPSHKC